MGFGNSIDGTFSGNNITKKFFFNTKVNSISNEVSPIKRVEYELIDDKFTRKQFFSSNLVQKSSNFASHKIRPKAQKSDPQATTGSNLIDFS